MGSRGFGYYRNKLVWSYHELIEYRFMSINKFIDMKLDPNPYINGVKTYRISGIYCHLY